MHFLLFLYRHHLLFFFFYSFLTKIVSVCSFYELLFIYQETFATFFDLIFIKAENDFFKQCNQLNKN